MPHNRAAWLMAIGQPLEVREADMPVADEGEIILKTSAIAINPIDRYQAFTGKYIREFPTIIGQDVAGIVFSVGPKAKRFKAGDRVVGHTSALTSGARHGAFALYTVLREERAAILPGKISFTDGVVLPLAFEAACSGLYGQEQTSVMGLFKTPALGIPLPTQDRQTPMDKILILYGGASSVGLTATQLAVASGVQIISIASSANRDLCRAAGAAYVIDYKQSDVVQEVVEIIRQLPNLEVIGVFDAVSSPETHEHDAAILQRLGIKALAVTGRPPSSEQLPQGVKVGMVWASSDVSLPLWNGWLTAALNSEVLCPLPRARVAGHGLEAVQQGIDACQRGLTAEKVVIEL